MSTYSSLPENSEEAFSVFVLGEVDILDDALRSDRNLHQDINGNYSGSFAPERSFVTSVLAFLDEYGIESSIEDISELNNEDFEREFGRFQSKVGYLTKRFQLRQARISAGTVGTLITISSNYKENIGDLIGTIRKIVNQEVKDQAKRDKLFSRLASLQSEVDRDRTTVDAVFSRIMDVTDILETGGEKVKALVDQVERLKKLFWDGAKKVDLLPKPDRPKQISKSNELKDGSEGDMDDEIPF